MESIAETVEKLAREAGVYAQENNDEVRVGSKNGDYRDVVTNIDIAVSNKLQQAIAVLYPDDAFYSEEDQQTLEGDKRTWVIDPIDGTSNYARSIPYYSSCVTVIEKGQVIAAAVYAPALGECFVLVDGQVLLNGQPVAVGSVTELKQAYVNFHPGRKEQHREWAGTTKVQLLGSAKKTINLASSALDLCYVACGRVDVVIFGTLTTLDIAGAVAMVRAAGGEVYNYETREPVAFSSEPQRIIATSNRSLLADYFDKMS